MTDVKNKHNVSHPFDREEEVSLQQLFTAFCNHLTLGQWELARVCFRGLFDSRRELGKPLKEILRAIIDQPQNASYGSPSVPSPFHLSWLCLVEYLDLFTSEEDQIPEPIVKKVEFHLLLYLACKDGPKNLVQDIDDYHSQIVYRDPNLFASGVSDLPSCTLLYLKQLLWKSPQFGHAVMKELSSKGKAFVKNNQLLQQLYLNLINEHLKELDSVEQRTEESDIDFINIQQRFIYRMLACMDPTSEMLELSESLDILFKDLLNRTFQDGPCHFDKGTLYSCFLGRSTTYLVNKFCAVENQMLFCSQEDQQLLQAPANVRQSHCHQCPSFPSSFAQICYNQSFIKDRKEAWRYLFFHALEGNHILENLVETALVFIRVEDYSRLKQLLSPAEFVKLKPLILLLGWPYCYSCENAKNLLEALWDPDEEAIDPSLYQACQKLAYQVQLVQWCTEKASPLLASSEGGSTRHQQASEMFQGLETHSVLHVLHKSIKLTRLPEKEVFELLRKRPVFSPFDTTDTEETSVDCVEKTSFIATHNDCSSEQSEDKLTDQTRVKKIHPEVERDVVLYHSYCALRNFMEAVTASASDCEFPEVADKTDSGATEDACSVTRDPTEDSDVEPKPLVLFATRKLQCGKGHLSHIYPLTYRVEILENIFSLLFGTYEDLYEGRGQQNESDSMETWDEETRSLAKSSRTASWESLTSSIDMSLELSPVKDKDKSAGLSTLTHSTPETAHAHKEVPDIPVAESQSRKQLFRIERSESDSALLKKTLDLSVDENLVSSAPPRDGQTRRTKQVDSEPVTTSSAVTPGKGSPGATGYDDDELKYGFVVEDELVPEVLKTLKECLLELNTAKFIGSKASPVANRSPGCLRTSVPDSAIEQRISRLGQFINEAHWRYQLVSWNDGSSSQKPGKDKKRAKKAQKALGTKEHVTGEDQQYETSEEAATEDKSGPDDNQGKRKKRKRRRRLASRSSASESMTPLVKDDSMIARMLSSPDTLTYMCMRKNNFERAFQVIKMFNMADKPSGQAAIFADKYAKSVKHLESLQPKERRIPRQGLSNSRQPLGALSAVAMAAASGVGTSLASNVIDDLLATPDFTAVLNPCLSPVELDNGNPALHKFLNPDLVPSMLCLDLACTASVSWPICKTLLDVGKGRVTKAAAFPSKSAGSLLGVAVFLNQLVQRLAQEQSRDSSKSSGGGIYIPITPKPNAMEILLSGTQPIRPKDMEAHTKTLASQEDSFRRLEVALDEGDTLIKSISEAYNQGPGHKHVGRQQSFNVMERSLAVRVGMIELQKAFDCVENASHVIRATGERVPERLDYIHSLFKHVESLATLLLFWQTRSPETLPMMDIDRQTSLKVTNPFVVLNEGIEDALGRPMFEKNISPKSLEGVAKKLNVNLSKVIVYNCCHGVPSRGGVTQADIRWPCSEPVILNAFSRWSESTRDPNTVAKDLLSRMIQLLKGVAQAHGGVVDSSSAVNAVNSPEFQAILHGTAELQTVDLDLLDSDASKICFFTNTLNLLIAHASLIQFTAGSSGETSEMETPFTRHASFTRLVDALSSSGGEVKVEGGIPPTSLERIAFLKQHSYCVGQLGPVSAFDLQYVMLHKGLLPPSTFGQGVIMCFPERLADDPKRKYRLTTAEKRVIFAICDGCVSSPPLQVFDVAELDAQLSAAVVSYINSRVTLHQQSGEVTMPELLLWYRKDFEDGHLDSSLIAQETDVSLLLQMEPYLYPDVASKLQEMLPQIKEISFTPFCWTFGYRFEPVLLERSFSSSGFQRSNSVPDNIGLSLELSVLKNSGKRGLFNLNETALEYLEEKSPLIAALVSLVSPAPHKVEQLFVRDIEQSGDHRSATDVCKPGPGDCANQSDELPLKHALQKTAKFPALQRCILTKLHTVADMLNVNPIESEERDGSYGSYDLIRLDSKPHFVQGGGVLRPPEICLYSVALAPDGGRPLQNALLTASDYYLREGLFEELFELINSSDLRGDGVGGPSIDFLLSSAILSKGGRTSQLRDKIKTLCSDLEIPEFRFSRSVHGRPWTLLPQIKDDESLARLVLTQLKERRAKDCIDLIDLCLSRPLKNVALRKELEKNGKEITLYRKIARCAKTQPFQAAITDDRGRSVSILKQWQGVAAASEEDPAEVIELLLSVQQFELAVEWAHLKSLPRHFHMIIQENHVKFLLENSPEDHVKAYRILETLHDQEMALSICESLLSQKLHVGPMLFIIQFMLTNLPSLLSPIRIEKLLCTKMGAKALLCLPEFVRCNYEHLVSRPLLLLEQLLMNMKVEWAAKVLKKIQVDLSSMEDVDGIGYHCCTVKAFDDLLTKYSTKALEFQVIQMERSQTKEFCSSIMQSLLKSTASSPAHSFAATDDRIAAMQASGRHVPITSTPAVQRDVELATGSLDRKNMRPTQAAVLIPEKKIQRHSQTIAPRLSDVFGRKITVEESFKKATALISDQQSYIPPIVPPKREDWMPDLQVKSCVVCGEFFSMFNRRHHCRRCGRVVCGTCSQRNHQVAGYGKDPVRVCDTCYNYFYTDRVRSVRADVGSSLRSLPVSFEKGRSAHGVTEQPEYSVPSVGSSFMDSTQVANLLMEDMNTAWKLRLDDEHNNLVREEFFYEQAPSASLCVSILDLHSDIKVCGRLILDLCNSLSQKLVPSAPGMRNEELDHNLVISMIRYLLFNAKLKMIKIGETQSVELCDTYLGHVDLLKFLVESNCGDIPSLRDLVHPDSARRLRDRFIESERLILAMEVSTKCGLDPSGVWGAVGFALLQAGDFPAAREKFARCMKSEGSSKQHQKQSAQYLKKIIQILESSPFLAFKQTTEELMGPLRGLMESSRNSQPGSSYLDPTRYDECLYYLQSYGSPTAMVDFYVKHNNIRLACRYILDKQCSVDVFIEMLKTCLALKGKFAQLKEQMEAADPTLQAWMPYLTAACKFLLQRSFYHALYELQVFMRDCFRAAQTCILFYSGVAGGSVTTYEDLYSRLHYLDKARQHIEEVIAEKRSPKGTVSTVFACLRQRNAGTAKGAAVMSLSDLDSHLNTINLQVEVTNFMHRCAVEGGVTSLLRAADIGRLPTLFGNGSVRAEMAVQVLLAGATVQDGFSLASRIIQLKGFALHADVVTYVCCVERGPVVMARLSERLVETLALWFQDFNLPAARVYVDAGRSLARQYRYSHIEQLLRCSEETGQVTDKCHDDIILACVNVISADKSQAKRLEALIKLLKSDVNKINAFMMCGKLKSAYLVAQKSDRVQAIQEIYEVALKTGQSIMVEICRKFLSQHQKRQDAQQRRGPQKKHAGDLNR